MARTKQMPLKNVPYPGSAYIKHVLNTKRWKTPYLGIKLKLKEKDELTGGIKKCKKAQNGTRAISEIRKYQRTTDLVLNKVPFQRLVKQIVNDMYAESGYRMQSAAIGAIQVVSNTVSHYSVISFKIRLKRQLSFLISVL